MGEFDKKYFEEVVLPEMHANPVAGGICRSGSSILADAGEREFGIHMDTVQRSLKWCSDPMMRNHLQNSEFRLRDMIDKKKSVHVILPFDYMKEDSQIRWMRLITAMAITVVQTAPKRPKPSIFFILDEFASLGHFSLISNSLVQMRSAGIKILMYLQSLKQLSIYPRWEVFVANSNCLFLSLGVDSFSSDRIAAWLGQYQRLNKRKIKTRNAGGGVSTQTQVSMDKGNLMTGPEVSEFLSKGRNHCIVIPGSGLPMRLKSMFFKHLIPANRRTAKTLEERRG